MNKGRERMKQKKEKEFKMEERKEFRCFMKSGLFLF